MQSNPILLTMRAAVIGTVLSAATASGIAQAAFPDKSVHIVIPFPAGAAADNAMRVIGRRLGDLWGKPVVIENKPAVPGVLAVINAPADGYTLLMGAGSNIVTAPLINSKLPYNPGKQLVSVARIATTTPVLIVGPHVKASSVASLIADARKHPGKLNYSSSGIGSPNHLAMEMFQHVSGTSLVHIPYKGGAPSVNELLGGSVDVAINAVPSVIQHIRSGRVTALAVISQARDPSLPNVPTISEAGLRGFEYDIWYGLFAPQGTPGAVVSKLSDDVQRVLNEPDVVRSLAAQGTYAKPQDHVTFGRFLQADTALWSKIIKDRNIKAE